MALLTRTHLGQGFHALDRDPNSLGGYSENLQAGDVLFRTDTGNEAIYINPSAAATGWVFFLSSTLSAAATWTLVDNTENALLITSDGAANPTLSFDTRDGAERLNYNGVGPFTIRSGGLDFLYAGAELLVAQAGTALSVKTSTKEILRFVGTALNESMEYFGTLPFAINTGGVYVPLAGTGQGTTIERVGGSLTEGLERVVFDDVITPAAIETAILTIPTGSRIQSMQANVQAALVAGGTSVTWSIGTSADPDKYGTHGLAAGGVSDSLAQNGKSNWMPDAGAFLLADEAVVLTAAATGGAADGDTAFSAGSVRVRCVYYKLTSLDNA